MAQTRKKRVPFGVGIKLGAVVVALASVAVLLLWMLVAEKNIAIAFAQKEVQGNQFLQPLRRFVQQLYLYRESPTDPLVQQETLRQLQRCESALVLSEKSLALTAQRPILQTLATRLSRQDPGAPQLYPELASLAELLNRRVGDTSNLILDPDLDSYYLMEIVLLRLPAEQQQLSEVLAELRQSRRDIAWQARLLVKLGLLREGLSSQSRSLETAFMSNPTLIFPLRGPFDEKQRRQERFLKALEAELRAPDARQRSRTVLYEQAQASLGASFHVWDEGSQQLHLLLQRRITGFEQRKRAALLTVALVLIPALGFSSLLVRQIATTLRRVALRLETLRAGDITRLERGIVALAEGKHDITLESRKKPRGFLIVKSQDELGRLAQSVNRLSRQAHVTLEALAMTQGTLARAEAALRQSEELMRYQAFHDSLTGLPNRAYMMEQLSQALERARRQGQIVALLFLDLDNFKVVNDSRGHEAGDTLLREITQRLVQCVRPDDMVARLGGDEFLIVMEELNYEEVAIATAEQLCRALELPILIEGQEVFSGGSLGIAFSRSGVVSALDLIKHADIAMYRAKTNGKQRFVAFDAEMNAVAQRRMALESDLRHALTGGGELCLHFQPIYRLSTGELCELEALLRWNHPALGLVMPDRFIALAEETGLIIPIGEWVLRTACQFAHAQQFPISVNISLRQLQCDDFLTRVQAVLRETKVAPELIKLEVTETLMMENPQRTTELLIGLKSLGIQLALDDFGAGYSSMTHLRDMPIDTLKIDRSFVKRLGQSEEDEAIVAAMVHLAQALQLSIVCEGIETQPQQDCLERLDCHFGQGFLYSPPQAPDIIIPLLHQYHNSHCIAA